MTTHQDTNTERNCRVQERYDELMQAGKHGHYESMFRVVREEVDAALASRDEGAQQSKLWLWKNFVNGSPEYWAFDNPFPVHMDCGDPQTIGEPCGYALLKPSRNGRADVTEAEVLRRIQASQQPQGQAGAAEVSDEQIQVAALQLMERHPEWVALKTLVPFGDELSPFSIGLLRAILALKATAGGVA